MVHGSTVYYRYDESPGDGSRCCLGGRARHDEEGAGREGRNAREAEPRRLGRCPGKRDAEVGHERPDRHQDRSGQGQVQAGPMADGDRRYGVRHERGRNEGSRQQHAAAQDP